MAIASYTFSSMSVLSLFLLLSASHINPTTSYRPNFFRNNFKMSDGELSDICSKTIDPSFCLDTFKHDSQTPSANYVQLCRVGLTQAVYVGSNGQSQAKSYADSEKDPQLQVKYQQCATSYDTVMGKFQDAELGLEAGQIEVVKSASSEADGAVDTRCSKGFGPETVVGTQSRQTQTLAQAVVAIADHLLGL